MSLISRYHGAAGFLFLLAGASTCQQSIPPTVPDFSAPQSLALICLRQVPAGEQAGSFCPENLDEAGNPVAGAVAFETVPLESCNSIDLSDVTDDNFTNTVVPNSFLFALVSNTARGDVGVVSLNNAGDCNGDGLADGPCVLDSDSSIPGINFIQVGEFPSAIAVDVLHKRFVTANANGKSLSIFENTDLIRCSSNQAPAPSLDLAGSPKDMIIDSNGIAYVTMPELGELVAVDLGQSPAVILGRADITAGAPGVMRPTRLAISEVRRRAYVSNGADTFIAEVDLDALVAGVAPTLNFIDVQSRTGAIAYLPASTLSFQGTLEQGQELPTPIDIPETLYVGSLDFVGQVLVVDVENRALVNLRPDNSDVLGPGIRVGGANENLDPVVDIRFFIEPLLPVVNDPEDELFIPRQDRPNSLQGAFAFVTTNDADSFVVNLAPVDAERRCCATDGEPDTCNGGSISPSPDGTCPEGVFLPAQAPHTLRNTLLEDEPILTRDPQLFSPQRIAINLESSTVQRFPTIGNTSGCLGGEGDCGFDSSLDPRVELPEFSTDVFNEIWSFGFEGVIPGTLRSNGALVFDTLSDEAAFCERGIEVGDILQILSTQKIDAAPECANLVVPAGVNNTGAFDGRGSPFDDGVTAEVIITEVLNDRLTFAPRAGVENPPADLSACYSGPVLYRIRVHDAFLVSGQQPSHNFLHRQVANADGTCAIDGAIDPLFDGRAEPGRVFNNIVLSLEITDPTPPQNAQGEVASFRDTIWFVELSSGFQPWGVDPDITSGSGNNNIAGGVAIVPDGTSAFATDTNLDRMYEIPLPFNPLKTSTILNLSN